MPSSFKKFIPYIPTFSILNRRLYQVFHPSSQGRWPAEEKTYDAVGYGTKSYFRQKLKLRMNTRSRYTTSFASPPRDTFVCSPWVLGLERRGVFTSKGKERTFKQSCKKLLECFQLPRCVSMHEGRTLLNVLLPFYPCLKWNLQCFKYIYLREIGFPFIWMPTDCKQEHNCIIRKITVLEALNLYLFN